MQSLNRAVDALASSGTASARAAAIAELEGLLEDCTAAVQVWQQYLDAPGTYFIRVVAMAKSSGYEAGGGYFVGGRFLPDSGSG